MLNAKNKPRGKVPSLIGGSNGRPRTVIVQRQCHCFRCEVVLAADVKCYEIPKLGRGFANYKRYCPDCFLEILTQTQKDIAGLKLL